MAPGKADEGKVCIDRLRAFQRSNQANKRCANCPERGPTYVCLDFQIFVCQQCSGLHRGFGHKIKSISLSEWSLAEVAKIEEGGNEKSAAMYLHRYNKEATTNPEPESADVEAVREFIKAKFVDKKWFRPHSATPEPEKTQAPAAVAAVPSTTSAPAATAPSGAGGYAAAAPRPPQAAQIPMMDLLTGGGSSPVAAAGRPAVVMSDLLDPTPAPSTQAWTADFASNAPEAASALGSASAGLTDLDFSAAFAPAKASPPLPREADIAAVTAPIAEPAEEPAPTQDDDGSASMGEKLRQAVLSGSQDDLKRLFDQCSKPAQMKTTDPDRVKAFAAFDELFGDSSGGEAKQQDAWPKLEGEAPAAQAASLTSQEQQQQQHQQPLMQQSQADSDFSGLLQEMTSLGLAASIAPAASSSAPPFPAAAVPAAAVPAAAQVPAAAMPAAAVPAAAQGSSDVLSQQKLAQLMPQGMAGKLTPGQLEQMSPQELLQMQMMISSALQARTPQQPAGAAALPSPPPWQTAAALSQHSSGSAPDIDWGVTDTNAQFGELVDMFQQKKS